MTIDRELLGRVRIEPLDRRRHDRAAFSCGVRQVDAFLATLAGGLQDVDATRVYVVCLDGESPVVGFYAMNAHALDLTSFPEPMRKKLPRYPVVPAIYLSVVGVDGRMQNKGLGQLLMADAMRRAATIADQIGAAFLTLDPLNEDAARLYERLKFVDLPGHKPRRMIIAMKQVRAAMSSAARTSSGPHPT